MFVFPLTKFQLSRIFNISPLGDILQKGFIIFVDEKDTLISLTPLYLLCGLSFPLWMPASNVSLFVLLSGVLTVGIGDTAASFVGSKWGKHKWPGLEKSMEGTLGCIASQLGTISVLAYMRTYPFLFIFSNAFLVLFFLFFFFPPPFSNLWNNHYTVSHLIFKLGYINDQWLLLRSIPSIVAISFIETKTDQIDNLVLPLLMYLYLII